MCRLSGLNSEMKSFNFKLLHSLLPVRARLHQLTPSTSPTCNLCTESTPEDAEHALLKCSYNAGTGQALLTTLVNYVPDITNEKLLYLQFPGLTESEELPLVFFTSAILLDIWSRRMKKTKITPYDIRATLEARCLLLRETRFSGNFEVIKELLKNL